MWTGNGWRTVDISEDSIREAMRLCRDLRPSDSPDVYVMTDAAKQKLIEHVEKQNPVGQSAALNDSALGRFYGIPIESFPTIAQAAARAMELKDKGKAVALVSDGGE